MDQRLYPGKAECLGQTIGIPGCQNGKVEIIHAKAIYRWRRRIEIVFGKLKENRRLAARDKKNRPYILGFIALAASKIHLS